MIASGAANPKGIFDRSSKGLELPPISVTVERGTIVFFAQVLGEIDPIYYDVAAARAAGYPDIVATPSFITATIAGADDEGRRLRQTPIIELIGCDYRYLLHGDEHYEYRGLVFAGDVVTLTTRIVDFYDKKGGAMEFATLEFVLEHAERGVLVRGTRTLLHRLG